jgi:transcriptional regulator with PAS, ATPase and Fis domain
MGEAIHVVDRDLRLVLCNTACQKRVKDLGLEVGTIGQNIFEVFPFLPDKTRDEFKQVFDTGKTLITEEINEIRGKKLLTETRKIPVLEGKKVVRVITVVRDISGRKRVEKKSE